MSLYKHARTLPRRFRLVLASFLQRPGLPFADALPEDAIQKAFEEEEAAFGEDPDAVYTPAVTLWAFLSQVLFKDEHRSCVAAVARVVVILSLATGMLTDMAMGPYAGKETGEAALLRELLGRFKPGDVLLADRYYCSYFMIALLQELGVDFVARVHPRRPICFRRGRRLGKNDHVVSWHRPKRPKWMDQQTYERMPASLEVRQVRVHVGQPGARVGSFVAVTTLTDAKAYPKEDIAQLYHCRWLAELDIRAIKITMGMDILRCKTPGMVRKEMWTCLLAYNLIRQTMLQSARTAGVSPRTLSFTAALQSIAAAWLISVLGDEPLATVLADTALATMAEHVVGNRPGRVEPRAIKRRPKEHALLTKPRAQARAELLKHKEEESPKTTLK